MSLPVERGNATSSPGRRDARKHNTDATLTDVHAEAYSHPGFPSPGHVVAAVRRGCFCGQLRGHRSQR